MKKFLKWGFIVIVLIFVITVGVDLAKKPIQKADAPASDDTTVLFDASQYSRISADELVNLLGEPKQIEDWNNETSKGTFQMNIYDYDIDGAYVEFITYEDTVVKIHWFANEPVEIQDEFDNVFKMFNVAVNDNARKIADTGTTYKFSPVSDKVAEFDVYNFEIEAHTFDTVYITYNLNYFD